MESKKLIIINIILLSILIAFLIYLMNETQEFIYNGFITFILTCGLVINGFILFKEKKINQVKENLYLLFLKM